MGKRDIRDIRRWSASDLVGARVGIYVRASDDSDDTKTSVDAQMGRGENWAESEGCTIAGRYCDNDLSASRYATKERPDFKRLLKDVEAGTLDVVWFWTLSRGQRKMAVYAQFRDLCAARGVAWVIKRRLYDLNDAADIRALNTEAGNAEAQSYEISENVILGLELSASNGRPHGPVTFGYRREYENKKYIGQYADEELHKSPYPPYTEYRKADIVREIIESIAASTATLKIKESLEARGIPTPKGKREWARSLIRGIATNPSYIGKRVHRGKVLDLPEPCWEPLVSEATFYAAQNVLNDPKRKVTKPGKAKYLLSYIARCGKCGSQLQTKPNGANPYYICPGRCCSIRMAVLDEYVQAHVNAYLSREDVREYLSRGQADDPAVMALRAEADRLRGQLEQYKALAESGDIEPVEYARISKGLKAAIAKAVGDAEAATVPPVLRGLRVDWDDIPKARQSVAALVDIRVAGVGKNRRAVPAEERVTITPLMGSTA